MIAVAALQRFFAALTMTIREPLDTIVLKVRVPQRQGRSMLRP